MQGMTTAFLCNTWTLVLIRADSPCIFRQLKQHTLGSLPSTLTTCQAHEHHREHNATILGAFLSQLPGIPVSRLNHVSSRSFNHQTSLPFCLFLHIILVYLPVAVAFSSGLRNISPTVALKCGLYTVASSFVLQTCV